MAVASFAISAGSQIMGFMGEQAAADQQNALYKQNQLNAQRAFQDTQVALNQRQSQEQEAAATDKFDANLEMHKALATERVAAGEAGVSGLSIENLMRDITGQNARYEDRVNQNTEWTMQQLQAEKKAQGYTYVDRVNSVQRAVRPSFASVGLRILGSGMDAYSGYKKLAA